MRFCLSPSQWLVLRAKLPFIPKPSPLFLPGAAVLQRELCFPTPGGLSLSHPESLCPATALSTHCAFSVQQIVATGLTVCVLFLTCPEDHLHPCDSFAFLMFLVPL